MPGALLALLALVSPTLRAVREVVYQLEQPFVVDHSRFAAAFGAHPDTAAGSDPADTHLVPERGETG